MMAWVPGGGVGGNMGGNAQARDRALRGAIQGSNRKQKALRKVNARLNWQLAQARQEAEEKGEELEGLKQEMTSLAEQLVAISLGEGVGGEEEENYRREISWLREELGRANQEVKNVREGMEERDWEIRGMKQAAEEQADRFRQLEKAAMLMQKHDPEGQWRRDPAQGQECQAWKTPEECHELEELRKQLDSTLGELGKVRKQLKGREELMTMTEHKSTVLTQLMEELQKETADKDGVIKQLKAEVENLKGYKLFLELRLKEMTQLVSDMEEGFDTAGKIGPAPELERMVSAPKKKQLEVSKKPAISGGMPIIESTFSLANPKKERSSSATPKGDCHSIPGKLPTSASTRPLLKPKEEQKSPPTVHVGGISTSGTDNGSTATAAVPGRSSWTQFRKKNSGGTGTTTTTAPVASSSARLGVGYHHHNRHRYRARRPTNLPARLRRSFHHAKDPSRSCYCLCGKKYKEEKFLWNHIKYYSKLEQCGICQGFFKSVTSLNRHMMNKHSNRGFIQAPQPGKAFPGGSLSLSDLLTPAQRPCDTTDRDRKPLQARIHRCALCAKFFKTLAELNMHRTRKHYKSRFATVTSTARSKFIDRNGQEHGVAEESSKPLPSGNGSGEPSVSFSSLSTIGSTTHNCICGKQFLKRNDLTTHFWFAKQRGIFQCAICPPDRKPFILHNDLKMHVRNVHKMRYGDGRVACCICAATFETRGEVARHRREVHSLVK